MDPKKRKTEPLGPGMELIGGGIDTSKVVGGKRCICSPGGWSYGNTSGNGCACGCSIIMPLSMEMRIKTWQAKHSELKEAWKSI